MPFVGVLSPRVFFPGVSADFVGAVGVTIPGVLLVIPVELPVVHPLNFPSRGHSPLQNHRLVKTLVNIDKGQSSGRIVKFHQPRFT